MFVEEEKSAASIAAVPRLEPGRSLLPCLYEATTHTVPSATRQDRLHNRASRRQGQLSSHDLLARSRLNRDAMSHRRAKNRRRDRPGLQARRDSAVPGQDRCDERTREHGRATLAGEADKTNLVHWHQALPVDVAHTQASTDFHRVLVETAPCS